MKFLPEIQKLQGGLIVSCQALEDEPLHSSFIMGRMALAAQQGGAVGIRANSPQDIAEIRKNVDLPVIGIVKRNYPDSEAFITASMREVDELMSLTSEAAAPEIIALDARCGTRPNNQSFSDFFRAIKEKYPNVLLMADCASFEEMQNAEKLGFDFIGTTLVGYTPESKGVRIEDNNFALIRKAVEELNTPIIAEGNINTPEKVKTVMGLGVFSIVVGSAITRPKWITEQFVNACKLD